MRPLALALLLVAATAHAQHRSLPAKDSLRLGPSFLTSVLAYGSALGYGDLALARRFVVEYAQWAIVFSNQRPELRTRAAYDERVRQMLAHDKPNLDEFLRPEDSFIHNIGLGDVNYWPSEPGGRKAPAVVADASLKLASGVIHSWTFVLHKGLWYRLP